MIDETTNKTPANVIASAEKIIPTLKATEQTRKSEMQKVISLADRSNREIGNFSTVFGKKGDKSRFAIFNEPVQLDDNRVGLVFATADGFKVSVAPKSSEYKLSQMSREIAEESKKHGTIPGYVNKYGFKPTIIAAPGYFEHELMTDNADDSIVISAIEKSIAKAQKEPKQTIARNRQAIESAGKARATITKAGLGK